MKRVLFLIISSLILVSCSRNPVEPTTKILTKVDTVYVHADTVKMQFQLNTDSVNNNIQYLIYADFDGNGFTYQPLDETIFRGNYQQYYLQWTFEISRIKNDSAKFKIIQHPISGNDTMLGVIYYYK